MQMFMKNTSYRKQKKLFHLDLHLRRLVILCVNHQTLTMTYNRLQLSVTATAIHKHVKLENLVKRVVGCVVLNQLY